MAEVFIPENSLEELIKTQKKEVELSEFIETFLDSDIAVPSAEEIMSDGTGMSPFLFDKKISKC